MNQFEFDKLSTDLRNLARVIPLRWGHIQNNRIDDKIDMFAIDSYSQLETVLSTSSKLSDDEKNYLRRRWYIWKCSQCDEYLFYNNNNVVKNPNNYAKEWDVCIDNQYYFDIKGTIIPQKMRGNIDAVIKDPTGMVNFFYDGQSTGRRYDIQNRLFIVHHSFIDQQREFYLRCAWHSKEKIYKQFCDSIAQIQFINTHNVTAGVIFILEREKNVVDSVIYGLP